MNSGIISLNVLDRQLDLETGGQDEAPACHLWEDEKSFHVRLAVPGWMPHQMNLLVENNMLTIQGTRSFESFLRLVKLPAFVNAEKDRAVYDNEYLTIYFRKLHEANVRRILIEVA